jgi:hypothetical protein
MLGSSSSIFDEQIKNLIQAIQPVTILELGCGQGKFGSLLREAKHSPSSLVAVQKIFNPEDFNSIASQGYSQVIDRDILDYYKEGFDEEYDLILALDVIEHFLFSDILSIINFSLYRSKYLLLVWPSCHPQAASTSTFDRHRSSFTLKDLADKFDTVFYSQTGFANHHFLHQYHIILLRGFMNPGVFSMTTKF